MKQIYLILLTTLFGGNLLLAQYSHQDVLQGQSGQTLLNNLVNNYKPIFPGDYDTARDQMFKYVYAENDTVTCVYTGLKRYLSPFDLNPRQTMFDNTSTQSIDTEHTYPQSKANNDAGKADLHHMFPTRALANNGRGSIPFGVINPNDIDKWYFELQVLTNAPAANVLHLYSKQDNGNMFEPRDDHKGNVARAMFYYYTMYKNDADAADPNFFNNQKATLCQWHLDDPVDSLEWLRTTRIANYQSNRKNPFVLDCSLPNRCNYCTTVCATPNAVTIEESMGLDFFDNYPNPTNQQTTISYQLNREQEVVLEVYNNLGQLLETVFNGFQTVGLHQHNIDASHLANGIYYYKLTLRNQGQAAVFAKPLVVAH